MHVHLPFAPITLNKTLKSRESCIIIEHCHSGIYSFCSFHFPSHPCELRWRNLLFHSLRRNLTLARRRCETLAGLARGQVKGTREVAQIQCFSKDADTRLDEVGVIPRGVADVTSKSLLNQRWGKIRAYFQMLASCLTKCPCELNLHNEMGLYALVVAKQVAALDSTSNSRIRSFI